MGLSFHGYLFVYICNAISYHPCILSYIISYILHICTSINMKMILAYITWYIVYITYRHEYTLTYLLSTVSAGIDTFHQTEQTFVSNASKRCDIKWRSPEDQDQIQVDRSYKQEYFGLKITVWCIEVIQGDFQKSGHQQTTFAVHLLLEPWGSQAIPRAPNQQKDSALQHPYYIAIE